MQNKVVPLPISLSKVTVPPSASVMRLTTANPKPSPLDLVVNNGVKIENHSHYYNIHVNTTDKTVNYDRCY